MKTDRAWELIENVFADGNQAAKRRYPVITPEEKKEVDTLFLAMPTSRCRVDALIRLAYAPEGIGT